MQRAVFWTIILAIAYGVAAFFVYRTTPLGQVALLDAREQQLLAKQISDGTLSAEPYYRAPLWAGVLSLFYDWGLDDDGVLAAGQLTNLLLHFLAALALAGTAWQVWQKRSVALIAGGLYAVYPVALYLAFDLLDTTLAQALLCTGVYFLSRVTTKGGFNKKTAPERETIAEVMLAGILLALSALARPQMLMMVAGAGIGVLLINAKKQKIMRILSAGLFAGAMAVFILFGGIEYLRTGKFYIIPTQGCYNLFAANRIGNPNGGNYYAQQMELTRLKDGENPARAEAEIFYERATGEKVMASQGSQDEMNRYYLGMFFEQIAAHPWQTFTNYTRKVLAFAHNHEGYNNKTYNFQKSQNPLLRWNPLGFALVAAMALTTVLFGAPIPHHRTQSNKHASVEHLRTFVFLAIIYILGAAIFYPSDRFRLPIVPLVILLAAAAPEALLWQARHFEKKERTRVITKGILIVTAAIFLSLPVWGIGTRDTTIADRILMTQAALKVGDDIDVEKQSCELLRGNDPSTARQSVIETLLQARYNSLLKTGQAPTQNWCHEQLSLAEELREPSGEANYVMGLCEWHLRGDRSTWQSLILEDNHTTAVNALAALVMTGPLRVEDILALRDWDKENTLPLLLAKASLRFEGAQERLRAAYGEKHIKETLKAWQNVFERRH